LNRHQEDEIDTTKDILAKIEADDKNVRPLLVALNTLLNNKALPSRQRRDVAGIARLVADSSIFPVLEALLRKEIDAKDDTKWFVYEGTIKLISQICWENPHLIEDLMATAETIILLLLKLLSSPETTPAHHDSLVEIVNFLHSVSLK
jgi:hypothetical protein